MGMNRLACVFGIAKTKDVPLLASPSEGPGPVNASTQLRRSGLQPWKHGSLTLGAIRSGLTIFTQLHPAHDEHTLPICDDPATSKPVLLGASPSGVTSTVAGPSIDSEKPKESDAELTRSAEESRPRSRFESFFDPQSYEFTTQAKFLEDLALVALQLATVMDELLSINGILPLNRDSVYAPYSSMDARTVASITLCVDRLIRRSRNLGYHDLAGRLTRGRALPFRSRRSIPAPRPVLLDRCRTYTSRSREAYATKVLKRIEEEAEVLFLHTGRADGAETNPFRLARQERDAWAADHSLHQRVRKVGPASERAAGNEEHEIFSTGRSKGKGRALLPISQIDWSKVHEDKVQEIIDAYRTSLSPVDSGIVLLDGPEVSALGSSSTKGKGRATDDRFDVNSLERFVPPPVAVNELLENVHPVDADFLLDPLLLEAERLTELVAELARLENEQDEKPARLAACAGIEAEAQIALYLPRAREQEVHEDAEAAVARDPEYAAEMAREEERIAELARVHVRGCAVCGDDKGPLEFPGVGITNLCIHPMATCTDCLHSWIASEFETKGTEGIKCPECPEVLSYADVRRSASKGAFAKYDKLCTRNALAADPDFAWCLAPGCESGQVNVRNDKFMHCAHCNYSQCLKHQTKWHDQETCEQYDYRVSGRQQAEEQAKTEAMLDTMSKICPGVGCGWRIEKSVGCDHMTCRKCRFQFCWQCLQSHEEIKRVGNSAHLRSCKFHSDNLQPLAWPFNAH